LCSNGGCVWDCDLVFNLHGPSSCPVEQTFKAQIVMQEWVSIKMRVDLSKKIFPSPLAVCGKSQDVGDVLKVSLWF
jgi:hypothetical protein